jgi:hypothetical protein
MRKLAPVFILTSIVALTSGSALALGDRNKDKKSPTAGTVATQSSTASPSGSASTSSTGAGMSGSASTNGSSKSDKAACKGLAKTDPAYAANQCDKMDESAKQASTGSTPGSSGSGK